jgi:DNA-entry nuclease
MLNKKFLSLLLSVILIVSFLIGCDAANPLETNSTPIINTDETEPSLEIIPSDTPVEVITPELSYRAKDYTGKPYIVVNNNEPYFTNEEKTNTEAFELYSDLDKLGRCGVAYANICKELMPTEKRESLSSVTPSGWHNKKYDFVDGSWVYNRAHIIGFQLAGEQANEENLITGTRYFNVTGMLPFENMVADYVKETNNHVLYRVTPVFDGNNLLCEGVLMEAWSVEDNGDGVCFNVFCYNVQPGVEFDYATGENWTSSENNSNESESTNANEEKEYDYVLNTNSKKFHYPDCSSAKKISDKNKEDFTGTRDSLLDKGYTACGQCKP